MKSFLIAAVCGLATSAAFAAEEPACGLVTQAIPYSTASLSLFRHGYLVLWPPGADVNGVSAASIFYGFDTYGRDGKLAYKKTIEVPGGSQAVVGDVDFDVDGNAAVAAAALGGPSQFLHVIVLLDRNGNQTGLIDTGRYAPSKIAVSEDRSIWTLGWQRDAVRTSYPDSSDYMIVRHFSWEGKKLGAYVARSTFPKGLEPGTGGSGKRIMVTEDRVGVLAVSGNTSAKNEWLELDLNGNVIERSRLDNILREIFVAAFTADDHVYLGGNEELYTLDRESHIWKPTPFTPKPKGRLMGSDSAKLVYDVRSGRGPIELRCVDQPEVR
jgi:hypothetical protein